MNSYEVCPKCGDVFVSYTCKNGGPNHGRKFSKCKVHGFFAWLDDSGRRIVEEKKPKADDPNRIVLQPMLKPNVRALLENEKTKKAKLALLRKLISEEPTIALFVMLDTYDRQTLDEQSTENTYYHNGVGFTPDTAEIFSSFARQWKEKGSLTVKQVEFMKKKTPCYAAQTMKFLFV